MIVEWSDKVCTNAGHCPTCGARLRSLDDAVVMCGELFCINCGCYVGRRKLCWFKFKNLFKRKEKK